MIGDYIHAYIDILYTVPKQIRKKNMQPHNLHKNNRMHYFKLDW